MMKEKRTTKSSRRRFFAAVMVWILLAFLLPGNLCETYAKTSKKTVYVKSEADAYKKARKGISKADFGKKYVRDGIGFNKAYHSFMRAEDHSPHTWWIMYDSNYENSYYLDGLWYGKKNTKKYITAENKAAKTVAKQIMATYSDDYSRIKAAHDYLCRRVTYDLDADDRGSAYAALVRGRAVCLGYAAAFDLILEYMNIKSIVCKGEAKGGGGHAWNMVMYKGTVKYVDVTWDDRVGYIDYSYFLKDASGFRRDHIWNKSDYAKKYLKWD